MKQDFLQQITKDCFEEYPLHKKEKERCFLPSRFEPGNLTKTHKEIAKELEKSHQFNSGYLTRSITTTAQNVHRQIIKVYQEEMKADEIDTETLLNRQNGQGGVTETIYHWLWEFKYPRFCWEYLKNKANNDNNWIGVPPDNHKLFIPEIPQPEIDILPLNQRCDMVVRVGLTRGYILLLNQGQNKQYLVCPSQIFAPECELKEDGIFLPQKHGLAKEQAMLFNQIGKEEFMGIVFEELPNFAWLNQQDQPVIELTRQHFEDLLSWHNFDDCPIFYKMFEVRSPHP